MSALLVLAAIAIEGATVHVRPGQTLERATIVIEGDRITAVGSAVRIPEGARRIDARGKLVTAGMIDAYTNLGLVEVALVAETKEGAFGPGADDVHAAYRVTDGYNPASVAIPVVRSGGITAVVAAPRGGLVAGTSALFALKSGAHVDKVTRRAPLAMHAVLGRNALAFGHGSRGVALERLREILDDARQYEKRRGAYERRQTREFAASRLDLEALVPVLRGQVPLMVHVDRAADIRAALRIAKDLHLRLVIVGGAEAWQVAGELAAARVPVIMDPVLNLPSTFDALHVREEAPAILRNAGVTVALSTFGSNAAHRLRQGAGQAVAFGMRWEDALAAVTSAPAEIFGLADHGVIKVGGAADLVVWSGDPLELSTRVLHVIVGGAEQPLKTRQTLLFERYRRP